MLTAGWRSATSDARKRALLLLFDVQNGPAVVSAAIRARVVRKAHAAALLALDEMHRLKRVMGAAAIAATLGQLTFWMRWHCVILLN
jgi:hypothetical protein